MGKTGKPSQKAEKVKPLRLRGGKVASKENIKKLANWLKVLMKS